MTTRPPISQRPRLTPGVPLGGIAAIVVAIGTISWAVAVGDKGGESQSQKLGKAISLAIDSHGIRAGIEDRVKDRIEEKLAAKRAERGWESRSGDNRAVDMGAISRSVSESLDRAAKLATAKAEQSRDRHDSDIRYLDRTTAPDGTNRLAAMADAPSGLRLANVVGNVKIKVVDQADGILFTLENSRKRYNLSIEDGVLWITGPGPQSQPPVTMEVSVPRGTPLLVNNFTGDLTVEGDLQAPARLELASGTMALGGLESVRVRITQDGSVSLGDVKGLAAVQVSGRGDVKLGDAGRVAIDLPGQGDVELGRVADGLTLSLPGPGSVKAAEVSGSLDAAIPGPGTLSIGGGAVDSLAVGVTGPGTVDFGGRAKDPRVLLTGPGRVTLAGHEGQPKIYHVGPGQVTLSR